MPTAQLSHPARRAARLDLRCPASAGSTGEKSFARPGHRCPSEVRGGDLPDAGSDLLIDYLKSCAVRDRSHYGRGFMESVPTSGDDPKPTERPMVTPAQPPLGPPTRPRAVNVTVILLLLGVVPLFVISALNGIADLKPLG